MATKRARGMFRIGADAERVNVEVLPEYWAMSDRLEMRFARDGYFYGYEISGENIGRMVKMASLLKHIADKVGRRLDNVLEELLKGHDQVVYDGRVSEFVKIGELLGPEWYSWRDDYYKMVFENCTVSCEARTAQEAQEIMIAKAAAMVAKREHSWEQAQKWLAAGSPVLRTNDRMPHVDVVAADLIAEVRAKQAAEEIKCKAEREAEMAQEAA